MLNLGGIKFDVVTNLGKAHAGLGKLVKMLGGVGKAAGSAAGSTGNFTAAADNATLAVGAFASVLGVVKLTNLIKQSTLLAGRVENLGTVLNNVGQLAGYSTTQINAFEESVKSLGITTRNTRESMALMAQQQLDLADATKLARIAQDAAVIAGINSSAAFARLTLGIQRTNTWILRNLGIMVNLRQLYRRWSLETGRATSSLSALEKQQIVLNEVLRKGAMITGTYEAAMSDAYKRFTSMYRLTEEASKEFGEQFLPVFRLLVDTTSDFLSWWTGTTPAFKQTIAVVVSATTSFFGMVAAVKALTLAYSLLKIMMLATNPIMLAAAAAGAALVATYVAITSAQRAATKAHKDYIQSVRTDTQRRSDVKKLHKDIKALADITDRSASQQTQLNTAMSAAIRLLPQYAAELQKLYMQPDAFAQQVQILDPGVLRSTRAELAALEARMIAVRKLRQSHVYALSTRKRDNIVDGRSDYRFDQARKHDIKMRDAYTKELQGLKVTKETWQEQEVQSRFQFLDRLRKQQTTASNLAMRTLEKFQKQRAKLWDDTNLNIFRSFEELRQQLSTQFLTVEQIVDLAGIERVRNQERLTTNFKKAVEGLMETDAKYLKQKARHEAQLAALDAAQVERVASLVEEQEKIREAFGKTEKIFNVELANQKDLSKALEKQAADAARGYDSKLSQLESELEKLRSKAAVTADQFGKDFERLWKTLLTAQKNFTEAQGREARDRSSKLLAEQQTLYDRLMQTRNEFYRLRVLQEDEVVRKIREREKELVTDLIAEEKKLQEARLELLGLADGSLESLRRQLDDYNKATTSVTEFIENIEVRLRDNLVPGFQDAFQELSAFEEALAKATSTEQITQLAALWPSVMQMTFDQTREEIQGMEERLDKLKSRNAESNVRDTAKGRKEFERLQKAGLTPDEARLVVQEEYRRKVEERAQAEAELEEKIAERRTKAAELAEEMIGFSDRIWQAEAKRRVELQAMVDLQEQFNQKKAEELKLLDEKLAKLADERVLFSNDQPVQQPESSDRPKALNLPMEPILGKAPSKIPVRHPGLPQAPAHIPLNPRPPAPFKGVEKQMPGVVNEQTRLASAALNQGTEVVGTLEQLSAQFRGMADATLQNTEDIANVRQTITNDADAFNQALAARGLKS